MVPGESVFAARLKPCPSTVFLGRLLMATLRALRHPKSKINDRGSFRDVCRGLELPAVGAAIEEDEAGAQTDAYKKEPPEKALMPVIHPENDSADGSEQGRNSTEMPSQAFVFARRAVELHNDPGHDGDRRQQSWWQECGENIEKVARSGPSGEEKRQAHGKRPILILGRHGKIMLVRFFSGGECRK
jgi:hypothetical protein